MYKLLRTKSFYLEIKLELHEKFWERRAYFKNCLCNHIDLQTQSRIDNKIQSQKPIHFCYEDTADAGLSTRIKQKAH